MLTPLLNAQIKVAHWIIQQGVAVIFNWVAPDEGDDRIVLGRYCADTKTVWVRRGIPPQDVLMALAHEAGHIIDFRRQGFRPGDLPSAGPFREDRAFLCGWGLLCRLGLAGKNGLVTKDMWRNLHFAETYDGWTD